MLPLYSHRCPPRRYYPTSMNFTRCAFPVSDGEPSLRLRGGKIFGNNRVLGVALNLQSRGEVGAERIAACVFPIQKGN